MTATIAQLGARALRKIGVAIVADAARPAAVPPQTPAQIADDMLRQMGITRAEADRPANLNIVSPDDIAARALRSVGINALQGGLAPAGGTITSTEMASRALRALAINPISGVAAPGATITVTEIGSRALRAVGVNPLDPASGHPTGLTYSVDAIATAALLKLAVFASEESPSTTDQADALVHAKSVHDALTALDYANWTSAAIPSSVAEFYIIMTANLVAPGHGKPANAEAYLAAQEMVRLQSLAGAIAQTRAEALVNSVHNHLVLESLADWNTGAIPDALAPAYVAMTAALLAPVHGKPVDPQAAAAAMAEVRHAAVSGVRGQALALAKVQAVHDELSALSLVSWALDVTPIAYAEVYVEIVERRLMAIYRGETADERKVGLEIEAAAIARLARAELSGANGQAIAIARVRAVHDEFNGLGLVAWTVDAVPTGFADYYVEVVAVRLASIYRTEATDERKASLDVEAAVIARMTRAGLVAGANARAIERVRVVHEELNALGLVTWPVDAIPVSVSDCYMAMASSKMQAEGGIPLNHAEYAGWVQRVRMVAMGGPAGQALAEQKIRAVHYSLEARGRVRWTLFDIPSFAEEPYVLAAAVLLGPECGVKVDPDWGAMAERDLMRIVSLPSQYEPVRADYL